MTDTKNIGYTSVNTEEHSGVYNLLGNSGSISYKAENFGSKAQPAASSIATPDIISGTVLSIDKNGKLISRKAVSVNGVIKYLSDGEVENLCDRLPKELQIRNIAYCKKPGNEKVIVVFEDGTRVIKTMLPDDTFDLNIGVALAVMEKMYGSKSQYHKMVQKKLPQKTE